jgi:mannose-6-phosphate isomerase-like protein (cupin superfamily)
MQNAMSVPNFPERESVGERPWGKEDVLVIVPGKYMLKHLFIKAGSKGGLQYHRLKDECGVLISGLLLIRYDDGSGAILEKTINPGDAFHFPPGCVHQEEAITDCVIIEGSTPHFNDRVRVEHEYDMPSEGGLPTTELGDILTK